MRITVQNECINVFYIQLKSKYKSKVIQETVNRTSPKYTNKQEKKIIEK